jgi:predicted acyl esterase
MVPTRAGFEIAANVYRPNKMGRFPVIMSMGPYGKDDLPAEYGGLFENGQIVVSEYAAFETADPEYWVHYDYVVIAADSAGSGRSGGDNDLFGPVEMEAFYDVIEWAGEQPWSNGNVGLNGESYFGVSQRSVAALKPPHLKAILPGEALVDVYRDAARHGGIPSDFTIGWMTYRIRPGLAPGAQLLRDLQAGLQQHPFFDDYWSSILPDLGAVDVPAYVIASWPDHGLHTRGTLIGFEQIGSEEKWLEIHGRKKWEFYYSRDSLERQRRFFDQYLKGIDRRMSDVPTVRYERRNAFYDGEIRFADDWPLPATEARNLFLTADGSLADEPLPEATPLRYDAEDAGAQLRFSHTFTEDTEITGTANLTLWVEAEGADDMDLFVGLSKLDTNGDEVLMAGYNDVEDGHVASGWLRVSHRELDADKSTELHPFLRHRRALPLSPGERVEVRIEILPSSTLFRAGELLVLRVQGMELPGAGGIGHILGVNAGDHIVHVGGETPSRLILPVIPQ